MTASSEKHWADMREAGTLFGLQFLRFIDAVFGRWLLSLFLIPTVAYFWLFRSETRTQSRRYLEQHARCYPERWDSKPGALSSIRHLYVFAESVVDKLLSWCVDIDEDRFVLDDAAMVERILDDSRGQLIIGSHFGNLEYCRGFMQRYKHKVINILVHDKHSGNFNSMMAKLNPDSRMNVYQVSDFDAPTVLAMKRKIEAGEWLFIAGDRVPLSGQERTVAVEFLGKTAHLPIGPYLLAKGLKCPVKLMFSYCDYSSKSRPVHFKIVDFAEQIELPRGNRDQCLLDYAQHFASELAAQCKESPYHWFNFYDFWAGDGGDRNAKH
ncbi:MAG: hypothetical protein AB8B57_08325 [Congregibacter sp.]